MSFADQQPDPQAPTCPRHPGVVAYVRCARCGRPACPPCQRPAAVGFHCVDCVRESARQAPQQRTAMGAPVSARAAQLAGGAPVTLGLVAACVLVYLAQLVQPSLIETLGFVPFLGRDEPWRFVTAAFLHGGTTHILFNMLALWTVGQGLERALGWSRFLALYLVSAAGGSVGFLVMAHATTSPMIDVGASWQPAWNGLTVGASGAVFGLFAAELLLARLMGRDPTSMLVFLGINLLIGFTVPNIAWQAHLGGFITGAAVTALVWATRSRERARWQWPAIGLVLLVLMLLCAAKYATVPSDLIGWGTRA